MKKITTLMVMLLCCIGCALAQTVAGTATPLENLQSGYYVMQMKVTDNKFNAEGNFIYFDDSDNKVHYDEQPATDHDLRSTTLTRDAFNYVFYIDNTDGKLQIKAYGSKLYWPSIPEAQPNDAGCNPGEQMSFVMATGASDFTYIANDDWYFLQTKATKCTKKFLTWLNYNTTTVDVNVKLNSTSERTLGFWDDEGISNRCQFQLFAVEDMPEPGTIATITYNYTYDGIVRGTSTNATARIGNAYPDVNLSTLPDFLSATKPEGTVEGDATIEIPLQLALPFNVSTNNDLHYYYLDCAKDVRLYSNSGLGYRTAEQASTVNGVKDDLWYVTGNPFDGFQFHNVSANSIAKSAAIVSDLTSLSFSDVDGNDLWYIFKNGDNFSICPHIGKRCWIGGLTTVSASNQKQLSWRMNDSGNKIEFRNFESDNDAFKFAMVAPTFNYTLYDGGDGHTYNTFSAPFDVVLSADEDEVKMYKGTVDYAKKELTMEEVDGAPAGTGVLFMGTTHNAVKLMVTTGVSAIEGNDLVGNTEDVTDLSDKLILGPATDDNTVGFFAAADGVNVLYANHAYLLRESLSDIKGLSISFGGNTTGIGNAANGTTAATAPVFDLTGRRVMHTVKGQLYIQGGRKFIAQ